eukprot:7015453-Prymnesium_polylepis.1
MCYSINCGRVDDLTPTPTPTPDTPTRRWVAHTHLVLDQQRVERRDDAADRADHVRPHARADEQHHCAQTRTRSAGRQRVYSVSRSTHSVWRHSQAAQSGGTESGSTVRRLSQHA